MNNLAPGANPEPLPLWEETLDELARYEDAYWDNRYDVADE